MAAVVVEGEAGPGASGRRIEARRSLPAEVWQEGDTPRAGRDGEGLRVHLLPGDTQHPADPLQGESGVLNRRHRVPEARRIRRGGAVEVGAPARVRLGSVLWADDLGSRPDRQLRRTGPQE